MGKEEYAMVLDFLPNGYPFDKRPLHRKNAVVLALGKNNFTLLELVPKKDITLQPGEEIYIGEGKREKIHHIVGRIPIDKLTQTAKKELKYAVKEIVDANKAKFMDFFNKAGAITTRRHQIELLPGIGKKHMWEILEQRKEAPFKDFEDLKKRVRLLPNPEKAIVKRILMEIEGKDKYRIFVY
ncbi:MAG: DUF655 domain-containing protein [Nanoarchaeota archaeon]|nr:DUF655 domain-containing protein [Nanoarchaeota archaeon]